MSFHSMLSASCLWSIWEDAVPASCGFALVLSLWTLTLWNPEPGKNIGHRFFTQHWKGNKGGSSGCITTHWTWTHRCKMFFICMYMCALHTNSTHRNQERLSHHLKLELRMIVAGVTASWLLETELGSSVRVVNAPNHRAFCPGPLQGMSYLHSLSPLRQGYLGVRPY